MSEQTPPASRIASGTIPPPTAARRGGAKGQKPPRWTKAFLRALARHGQVRRAADDAAVDFSTAYARRRVHADFAAQWREALADHSRRKQRAVSETIVAAPAPAAESAISGGKLRRVV